MNETQASAANYDFRGHGIQSSEMRHDIGELESGSLEPSESRLLSRGRGFDGDNWHWRIRLFSPLYHLGLKFILPNQARQQVRNAL